MSELECPYCESLVEPDDDQREQDVEIEIECPKCGKSFVYTITYYPSYTSHKADCLNDGEHDWKESFMGIFPEDWPIQWFHCSACGARKQEPREVKNDQSL